MKNYLVGAALAAALIPAAAMAQEAAPDGSPAFGFEPYVAVMGGYHDFDSDNQGKLTTNCNPSAGCPDGAVLEGLVGFNVPLGTFFVGAEGNVAKGFKGIDWEYGAHVRSGVRAGDSGLIYTKIGYTWVDTKDKGKAHNWSYGGGVEVGPQDIGLGGLTGPAGPRLRFEVTTFDFHSIRPTAGVVFAF
jgi:outer membrane immunogenic protein